KKGYKDRLYGDRVENTSIEVQGETGAGTGAAGAGTGAGAAVASGGVAVRKHQQQHHQQHHHQPAPAPPPPPPSSKRYLRFVPPMPPRSVDPVQRGTPAAARTRVSSLFFIETFLSLLPTREY
ncbi:hypothetical protein M0802_016051, partial [Mischocyttarus mexicanus]